MDIHDVMAKIGFGAAISLVWSGIAISTYFIADMLWKREWFRSLLLIVGMTLAILIFFYLVGWVVTGVA